MVILDKDGSRELTDDILDLIVGGAGDPSPAVLERLLRDGAIRAVKAPQPTRY